MPNSLAKHLLPYVLIIGLILNAAFLFTVIRIKRMHTVPNLYLSLQTIADCVYLLAVNSASLWWALNAHKAGPDNLGPWYHLNNIYQSIFFSDFGCFTQFFITLFPYHFSLGIVMGLSYDRYSAVVYPLQHQMLKSKNQAIQMISAATIFGILNGGAGAIVRSKDVVWCFIWPNLPEFESYHRRKHQCVKLFEEEKVEWIADMVSTSTFFLTFTVTTVLYSVIVWKLSTRKIASDNKQVTTTRNQVARMVVITGFIFFIGHLPYRFLSFARVVERLSDFVLSPELTTKLSMSYHSIQINSALNAALYPALNPFYRKAYIEAFSFRRKPKPNASIKTTSFKVTETV